MTREVALWIMIALLVLFLFLAWRGWNNRVGRYRHLPELAVASDQGGRPSQTFSLLYVATTEAEKPMERVAKKPLAYRAQMHLGVGSDGLFLAIPGEDEVVLPAGALRGVGRATWTIDRVVDSDGLVFVRWLWGDTAVDSYFRSVDYPADDIVKAVENLIPPTKESA